MANAMVLFYWKLYIFQSNGELTISCGNYGIYAPGALHVNVTGGKLTVRGAEKAIVGVAQNIKAIRFLGGMNYDGSDAAESAGYNFIWKYALLEGKAATPLEIITQPKDWYGTIGKKATFTVVATGDGLSYQWQYKKGTGAWVDDRKGNLNKS